MRFILLNGPPRCGKDTIASIICRNFPARKYKMTRPMDAALSGLFNIDPVHWSRKFREELKDTKCQELLDDTPRDALISLSEDWIKQRYGSEALGELAIRFLSSPSTSHITVISDTGFRDEAHPLFRRYGFHNFLLVHVHREGCTFDNDSRSYWSAPLINTFEFHNRYDLELLEHQVCKMVEEWCKIPRR